MGRATAGVVGIELDSQDQVISLVATEQGDGLLTVTNNGYGQQRLRRIRARPGGLGVKTAMLDVRVGVLAEHPIQKDPDVLVIANDGVDDPVPAATRSPRRPGDAERSVMRLEHSRSIVAVAVDHPD